MKQRERSRSQTSSCFYLHESGSFRTSISDVRQRNATIKVYFSVFGFFFSMDWFRKDTNVTGSYIFQFLHSFSSFQESSFSVWLWGFLLRIFTISIPSQDTHTPPHTHTIHSHLYQEVTVSQNCVLGCYPIRKGFEIFHVSVLTSKDSWGLIWTHVNVLLWRRWKF